MERVALYMRVSTEEQARHGLSLGEQERSLEKYANDHKMKIIGKYQDGGISARKKYTKRPELMRLLADVELDRIDTVLFIKLDRWFRSVADYYDVQRILDDHHVTWRAIQEDYETVTASGRLKVNIMLSVAQDEADRDSERIRFIYDGKRSRNEPTNGRVPKGYKIVGKHVEYDPDTAPQIRSAFEMYWETGSPRKIIDAFPDMNFSYYSLNRLFKNYSYTGNFCGIQIPPIISEEEFDRTQKIRNSRVPKTKHNAVYIFSGLLFCPVCGRRLSGHTTYKEHDNWSRVYYACPRYDKRCGCTNRKWYREDLIEEFLISHIDSKKEALITAERENKPRSYKPQRDTVKRKISKLQDLYINEMIGMEEYQKKYNGLEEELESIPPDEPAADIPKLQQTFSANWKSLYLDLPRDGQQIFWRNVLENVTLDSNGIVDFSLRKNPS